MNLNLFQAMNFLRVLPKNWHELSWPWREQPLSSPPRTRQKPQNTKMDIDVSYCADCGHPVAPRLDGMCTCHSSINSFWAASEGPLSWAFPSSVSSRRFPVCPDPPTPWWYRIAELTVGMWGILPGCRFNFHCCPPYWSLIVLHAKQDAVQNLWLPLMTNATHWFINSDIKAIPIWLKSPFLNQGAVHLSVILTDSWAWWTQHPSLSHKALHSKFHVILPKVVGQPSLASTKGLRSWHRR
jgi:hypothetical protein